MFNEQELKKIHRERCTHFIVALLGNKTIQPGKRGWTVLDATCLGFILDDCLGKIGGPSFDNLSDVLSNVLGDLPNTPMSQTLGMMTGKNH